MRSAAAKTSTTSVVRGTSLSRSATRPAMNAIRKKSARMSARFTRPATFQ